MRFSRLLLGPLSLVVLAPVFMLSACYVSHERVVEPTEGYYDRDHHRYYHEHVWVACVPEDPHCPA